MNFYQNFIVGEKSPTLSFSKSCQQRIGLSVSRDTPTTTFPILQCFLGL